MNKVLPLSVSAQCVQDYHYKTFEVYAPNNTLINVDFDYTQNYAPNWNAKTTHNYS